MNSKEFRKRKQSACFDRRGVGIIEGDRVAYGNRWGLKIGTVFKVSEKGARVMWDGPLRKKSPMGCSGDHLVVVIFPTTNVYDAEPFADEQEWREEMASFAKK